MEQGRIHEPGTTGPRSIVLKGRARERIRSKKERILELYQQGMSDLREISEMVGVYPSYVAQVLRQSGFLRGYFDLYTSTNVTQNIYSPFFRNVLSFKDVESARRSVGQINALYEYFEAEGDRAGQHHAMVLALTGQNRARWCGKNREANIFHDWLIRH